MTRYNNRLLWGVILVVAGVLFLLQNVGLLPIGGGVWAILFALSGAVFIGVFLQNRANWWAVIPGLTLLGIGGVTALAVVAPSQVGPWIGAGFLFIIGLPFWIVYYLNRSYWWAIIPAGVLTTLALVGGLSTLLGGVELGGLFFVGLGLTFALVGVVPTPMGRMRWAFIPAGILSFMGLLVTISATSLANYITPIALLCVGGFLVWRAVAYRKV
jgi:hypothetical protein